VALLVDIDEVVVKLTIITLQDGSTYMERISQGAGETASHWTWTRIERHECENFLGLAVYWNLTGYIDEALHTTVTQEASRVAHRLVELTHRTGSHDEKDSADWYYTTKGRPYEDMMQMLHETDQMKTM
jgi:hypothetical protein